MGKSEHHRQGRYKRNIKARSRNHCCHVEETLHILCVCSLSYAVCKMYAPYYIVMWPVCLSHIFPHLINSMIFKKKIIEHERCIFIFSSSVRADRQTGMAKLIVAFHNLRTHLKWLSRISRASVKHPSFPLYVPAQQQFAPCMYTDNMSLTIQLNSRLSVACIVPANSLS